MTIRATQYVHVDSFAAFVGTCLALSNRLALGSGQCGDGPQRGQIHLRPATFSASGTGIRQITGLTIRRRILQREFKNKCVPGAAVSIGSHLNLVLEGLGFADVTRSAAADVFEQMQRSAVASVVLDGPILSDYLHIVNLTFSGAPVGAIGPGPSAYPKAPCSPVKSHTMRSLAGVLMPPLPSSAALVVKAAPRVHVARFKHGGLISRGPDARAGRQAEAPATVAASLSMVTLATFGETYFERVGKPVAANTRTCFAQLAAFPLEGVPFRQKALTAITEDDLEAFFAHLRACGRAASTRNNYLQTVKAMFRWAVRKGYLTRNPAGESESLRQTGRVVPISDRLLAVLDMAKTGPTSDAFEPDAFVFGDAVGHRVKEIKRAWETCVLKEGSCAGAGLTRGLRRSISRSTISGTKRARGCSRPAGRCTTWRTCTATPTSVRRLPASTRLG